jgi:hypothetical protein
MPSPVRINVRDGGTPQVITPGPGGSPIVVTPFRPALLVLKGRKGRKVPLVPRERPVLPEQ